MADQDADTQLHLAQATLQELLEKMQVAATVSAAWGEQQADDDERPLMLDVQGDDLSILIGRKGETLAALQYVTRLLVGKQLSRSPNLIVDVESYRRRRQDQLRHMAQRIAEQVIQRQRPMSLEPMPPDERRIIHLELRDHPSVRTESIGEGNRRKVTILPK